MPEVLLRGQVHPAIVLCPRATTMSHSRLLVPFSTGALVCWDIDHFANPVCGLLRMVGLGMDKFGRMSQLVDLSGRRIQIPHVDPYM